MSSQQGGHYDQGGIEARRNEVLERWRKLKEGLLENRAKLGEAQSLQQFSRDVDEMEIWINEKLQTALDESYKDPSNIQVCSWCLTIQSSGLVWNIPMLIKDTSNTLSS